MGSPKALLRYRGASFLDTLCGSLGARCSPVIVVLGCGGEAIRAAVTRPAAFVVNPRWHTGQTGSMQCGLRAVPAEAAGVLFTLVDHPALAPATIDALIDHSSGALLRVPRYQGKRGHPIWFSPDLIPEFLALPETGAARDVVRSHAAQTDFLTWTIPASSPISTIPKPTAP
jgi:molybdenum cofactor cytidylyltransferase